MTISPVGIYPVSTSTVATGGTATTIIYGPVLGGIIFNPASADDQGIATVEVLYVDTFGAAAVGSVGTTVAIQPGQSFTLPANQTTNVSVNAATSGHKFSAIVFQPQSPVVPAALIGLINPCLQNIIPSYLYLQYANDDDLQAFVAAYNTLAQQYLTWLNQALLPVYTGALISGDLLDWVATGLYGVTRPILSTGHATIQGGYNLNQYNTQRYNGYDVNGRTIYTPVSDDIYKRVLTWKLYKGDGKKINVRWLKRRILRFLLGANGTDVNTADTTSISVTFGGNNIEIDVIQDHFTNTARAQTYNTQQFNAGPFNTLTPVIVFSQTIDAYTHDNQVNIAFTDSTLPNLATFQEAVEQGVLDLPFQFKFVVTLP